MSKTDALELVKAAKRVKFWVTLGGEDGVYLTAPKRKAVELISKAPAAARLEVIRNELGIVHITYVS
jgi:hypothetical protein